MSSTSSKPLRINPFPGLRPFTQEEDYLFFGREEQTMELLQRLSSSRFVAVVGTSGSGKSSLVRCGLLSELLGGRMLEAGSSWEVAVTHPGGNPLALLTDALLDADLYDREVEHTRENLLATLSRSHFGLVEAVKQSGVGEGTNFLLVVDQFEEIFRFQDAGQRQQEVANEYVSLLLEAVSQKEVPIYVVLTMRSDFIGECGQFEGLAEMVNRGEFLIPRLTREQYKRVIEGPIKVAGGKIAPRLLQRLLNDLGQQADQLPCLQHALMRTWNVWAEKGDADELDLDDYQRVGRMSQALSLHADEIFESLASDRQRDLCRGLFQALTVEESNNRGIRRPQRLGRLCQILEVSADELQPIIDAYRHSGVTFLMPSPEVDLTDQTIIDISHESLMRVWTRLRHWVEEEAQAVGIYRRLSESAGLHAEGKAGLYRDPELGIALAWREETRPNQAWAERYRPGFQQAIEYLERSHQAQVADEQAHEFARQRELEQAQRLAEAQKQRLEQQQRAAQKMRRVLAGLAVVAVVAVSACFVALVANNRANRLATLANEAANEARQNAEKAEQSSEEAEQSMRKAVASEVQAQQAEQRSREFRYATDMQLAATLGADKTTNATQVLARLSDHDPDENQELAGKDDLRGFEWYYLKRMVEGQSVAFKGFDKEISAIALNSDGEVVTLDGDSRIQHWNVATRQETRPSSDLGKNRGVGATALSPDGRRAALAIGNQVHLVDAVTGEAVAGTIPAQTNSKLLFSPDSRMLITVDTGIGWWDAATGHPIAVQSFKLSAYGPEHHPVSISADGLTLVVGGQGSYRSSVSVFKLHPESREIVLLQTIGNTATKRAAAISPDGGIVAVSLFFTGDLQLFDVATGTPLPIRSNAHSTSISAIAFSPDGTRLTTAAMDGSVRVWDDYKQIHESTFTPLLGHATQVNSVTFLSDGKRFATTGIDKSVRLWNPEQQSVALHRSIAGAIGARARFSADGTLMAVSGESRRLQLRDGRTGRVVISLPDRSDLELGSDSVAFSPDNRLLAAAFGGKENVSYIELWDIEREEMLAVLPGATEIPGYTVNEHSSLIPGLEFSPDGKYLVAGFGSMSLISSGDQGNFPLLVYDVAARRLIRRLEGHRNFSLSVAFSRDGSLLASASNDGTARLWNTTDWKEVSVLNNPDPLTDRGNRRVTDVAFSPDGKLLAMASAEGNVIIWNVNSCEQMQTLRGHANEVTCVAFTPDGRTLASGSTDRSVRLWNTSTWRELVRLEPGSDFQPEALDFSSDGRCLLAASLRGEAVIWTTEPAAEETGPTQEDLKAWRALDDRFPPYIRGESEVAQLREALETFSEERAEDAMVQTALAAVRANWYASRQEWKTAVEQFDRIKQFSPEAPAAWYRAPGIFRLATALFHEDRPLDAALLLHDGEQRIAQETPENRALDAEVADRWHSELMTSVSGKLEESPKHPGLLELRAELSTSPADQQKRMADYTAAIEVLKQQSPSPTADLKRLYACRGSMYVSLKQWQQAVDDFAQGITEETADVALLSSQALAQSFVIISGAEKEASLLIGRKDESHGLRLVDGIDDGITELQTINGEECLSLRMPQQYGHAYFIIDSDFKWSEKMHVEVEMEYRDEDISSLSLQYDAHDLAYKTARQLSTTPSAGGWKTARFELRNARFAGSQNAASDFRIAVAGDRFYIRRVSIRQFLFGRSIESPWVRLAAAHVAKNEQSKVDEIVEHHPEIAGPVADLVTEGETGNWQRAVEIYSKVIKPESADVKLLAMRARAYEQLKDYSAAANDWARAAGENPQDAKLLMEFAQRLITAQQPQLAAVQRQRARQVLEAVLQSDPDDAPALDSLAELLFAQSEPHPAWAPLKPAESTTVGVPIRPLLNNSALVETQEKEKHTLIFPVAEQSWKMVRIETSPEAAPSENDTESFTEYRVISTDLPTEAVFGRYVRIDLPGENSTFPRHPTDLGKKVLTLAEVQVFQMSANIAPTGKARQSSTAWEGVASRAIDGNVNGDYHIAGSCMHTDESRDSDPWWELDLGSEQPLERVVVWNRTDVKFGNFANRLKHFRVRILDASRRIKYEEVVDAAPSPSREILLNMAAISKVRPDDTEEQEQWQVSFENQFAVRPWRRLRISMTEDEPTLSDNQVEPGQLTWTAVTPSKVMSAGGWATTGKDDGILLAAGSIDSIPVTVQPETVNAVRIETAKEVPAEGEPDFKDYRIEVVSAPVSETGWFHGRFIRLDLPGSFDEFPRVNSDNGRKMLNLVELQAFQGERNIAHGKSARQSSSYPASNTKAENAVDGDINNGLVAHTDPGTDGVDPWWEVDLGSEQMIERIVVWNHPSWINRMNHFRIRVLDDDRDLVFEEVIDEAPNPSREIACRRFFMEYPPATADDKPRFALRLGKDAAIESGQPFRISTTETIFSPDDEEARLLAGKISVPVVRLAAAYDFNDAAAASVVWFSRAYDLADTDQRQEIVLWELQNHPRALQKLLPQRPDEINLQLTQARNHLTEGQKQLRRNRPGEALVELQQADGIFTRLLNQYPEPQWTILQPNEMNSRGGATLTVQPDGSILASGKNPDQDAYTVIAGSVPERITAIRLEALPDPSLPRQGPGRVDWGNFYLDGIRVWNKDQRLGLSEMAVTFSESEAFRNVLRGLVDQLQGWSVFPRVGERQAAVFAVDAPSGTIDELKFELFFGRDFQKKENLGRFRLSVATDPDAFISSRLHMKLTDSERTELDVAIGRAYAGLGRDQDAAIALAKGLDRVENDNERKKLIEHFQAYPATLTILAAQRPQLLPLQLTVAKQLAEEGKQFLADNQQEKALPALAQSRGIFSRLATNYPEPKWTVLQPTLMASEGGAILTQEADGSIYVSGTNPIRDVYTITAPLSGDAITALRLETIPDNRLNHGAGREDNAGEFLLAEIEVAVQSMAGEARELSIQNAYASFSREGQFGQPITYAYDSDLETQWGVLPRFSDPHLAVFAFDPLEATPQESGNIVVRLRFGSDYWPRRNLGRFRLSVAAGDKIIEAVRFHQELNSSGLADLEISLGKAHAQQGRTEEAVTAFSEAIDLAVDRGSRMKIVQEAAAYEGVLEQLAGLRSNDPAIQDLLARHYHQQRDFANASEAGAKARELYEQRLIAEPADSRLVKDLADLLLDVRPVETLSRNWAILKPTEMKSQGGATLTLLDDGSILAGGNAADVDVYTITATAGLANIQAFLLEAIPHESLPLGASGRRSSDGDFALTEFRIGQANGDRLGTLTPVPLTLAICDYSQPHSPVKNAIDGKDNTFWDILPHIHQPHFAAFSPAVPLTMSMDGLLTFSLEFKLGGTLGLGRFRLSATDDPETFGQEKARLLAHEIENPWVRLGAAYSSLGQFDLALDMFVRAVTLAGNPQAKAAAAQQGAAFEDVFARLLDRFPDDKSLRLGQAKYLASKQIVEGKFQSAASLLSGVVGDFPDEIELLNLRASAYMKLKQWRAADADYARIIDLESDPERRRKMEQSRTEVQLRSGQFQAAAEAFLQDMFLDVASIDRPREAIIAELLAGNAPLAKTASRKLYDLNHSRPDSGYSWGLVQVFTAQPGLVTKENSQKLLEAAQRAGGSNTEPMTAAIHFRLGNLKLAEPLLKDTVESQYQALAAMLLYDQGETDEARLRLNQVDDWFRRERAADPGSVIPIQVSWQDWAIRLALRREAARKLIGPRIIELDKSLEKSPDSVAELLERARLLADADLHEEAIRDLDRLIELKADSPELQALYGRMLVGLNRTEEALPYLNRALEAGFQDAGVFFARGEILLREGQADSAKADWEKSLALQPTELAARSLADLLLADSQVEWTVLKPTEIKSAGGATLTLLDDGSILASGVHPDHDMYTIVTETDLKRITTFRLEALPDESLPGNGPGRMPSGAFVLDRIEVASGPRTAHDQSSPQAFSDALADLFLEEQPMNPQTGKWHTVMDVKHGKSLLAVYRLQEAIACDEGSRLTFNMIFDHGQEHPKQSLGRFRLAVTDDQKAFEREQQRLAARKQSNPWVKLAMAFDLTGDAVRSADFFVAAVERTTERTKQLELARNISEIIVRQESVLAEFVQRNHEQPLLMAEVARQLSERGQLDAALSLRIRSRALLETQLAREPENAAVQSALADLLLESTDASWTVLSPAEMTSRGGATLKSLDDRSILASGLSPDTDVYTVTVTDLPARFRALRLEVLPYESPTHQGPGRALNGNFVLSEFSAKLHTTEPDAEQALLMTKAIATYEQAPNPYDGRAYPIVAVLDGNEKEGGWAIWPRVGQSHSAVFSFQNVVEGKTGASLTVSLFQNLSGSHQIGRFRISVTESPVAILQTAVSGLTDSRTKLAAAYLLAGDFDPAGLLLETSPVQAKELIDTWISSGVAVDGVLDLLKSRAPDVCVAVLPEAAGHAAEKGEMEAARLMYSRLIELKPENSLWKERLAQLQPGTVALWNFDTGLGTWGEGRNCKLAVRDGVLQVTETSADPHFFGPIAAPVGANVLALRYRREQSFWMEYFCGDARGDVYQSTGTRIDHVSGTEGAWRELLLPLSYKGPLNALRLDLNLGTGQTVEIDSIELRQVDATEYARLAREMVVEPTLARLKAEIDQEPQSSAKYSARATYLMQLGRWREAAEDMMQERKLTPADRVLWFREANCRLLAGDVAGYRKLCQGMIEQFRGTTDPQIADSVCKTCLLQPGAVELSDLPIPFLRNATVDPEQAGNIKWFVGCCALISYREGNYAEAVAWTLKDPEPDWQPGALTLVVRALAEHQLGQHEQARRTLAAADALIPVELHTLGMADAMVRFLVPSSIIADDWLAPEILRREARALIEPGTADPLPPAIRAP